MQLMFSPSQKLHKLHGSSSGLLSATPIYWLALLILRRKAKEKASLHAVETCSQKKGTVQKLSSFAGRSTPTQNVIYLALMGMMITLFLVSTNRFKRESLGMLPFLSLAKQLLVHSLSLIHI